MNGNIPYYYIRPRMTLMRESAFRLTLASGAEKKYELKREPRGVILTCNGEAITPLLHKTEMAAFLSGLWYLMLNK